MDEDQPRSEILKYFDEKDLEFLGGDRDEVVRRPEYEARRILERIHSHNEELGGVFVEITGAQGAGKTSVMLSFMSYMLKHHPEDKIFWSSSYEAPLQFLKIGDLNKIKILVKERSGVRFYNRKTGEEVTDKLDITYFKTLEEAYRVSEPGLCNAVFFGKRTTWMDFIRLMRRSDDWKHVFIDEFGEVAPSDQKGYMWKKIGEFSETVKEVRKCNINLIVNTQTVTDVDYRVRRKVMIKIFLPGARADPQSRVSQRAIDNLQRDPINGNWAYIDDGGLFGRVQFTEIYKPIPELSWEAVVDGKN